jgi:peptidoglycan/LPS O-acetylase OafA/YrhL
MYKPPLLPLPKVYFSNLDGLRSVAFLTVFIQHTNSGWVSSFNFYEHFWFRFIRMFLFLATDGVSFFFVLSGFLITYLLVREKDVNGTVNVIYFYIRRALRIWPLYYLLALAEFTVLPIIGRYLGWKIADNIHPGYVLSFLSNFHFLAIQRSGRLEYSLLGTSWSVAIEEQFYLLWPLSFYFLPKKLYKYLFFVVILMCCIFRYINRHDGLLLYFHTLSVFGHLAIGGLCGYYAYYSKSFTNWLGALSKVKVAAVYVTGFTWMFYASQFRHTSPIFNNLGWLINCLFFAFIIAEQCFCKSSLFKMSDNKIMSRLGKYTYGLYLLHIIGVKVAYDILWRFFPYFKIDSFFHELIFRCIAFLIAIGISYVSYQFYEKQFLRWKERFAISKTTTVTAPSDIALVPVKI